MYQGTTILAKSGQSSPGPENLVEVYALSLFYLSKNNQVLSLLAAVGGALGVSLSRTDTIFYNFKGCLKNFKSGGAVH